MAEGRTSEAPIVIQDDDEANQPAKRAAEVIVIDDADDDPAAKRRRTADDDDASLALARELQSQDDARAREPLPARGGAACAVCLCDVLIDLCQAMAKDKASTRKPRRRNARARDDGGTRRATEATPPVRASKRLSVQVSAAASAFLVNFRVRMDAIASIFVNYHEERQEFVAKTEAADLIEQNVAEMMGVVYRGALQFDFVLMLCRRLGVKDVFLFATEAGAPAWLTLGFEHVGSSASLIHLRFDLLFKRDRGVLARSARGPETSRLAAARWTARSRSSATPRASTPWSAVQERVAEYGEKQVVRLAKEAANAAAEAEAENDDDVPAAAADVPEHDLLAAPSPPRASSPPAPPAAPSPSALADASSSPPREAAAAPTSPEAAEPLEAAPPAPAPRRCAAASKKRVVDDADADDEDEAWEPGRPSMMDLDDDEQEQAAKAKRKLKRRSKKKSAKAKNAAGAAPHAPVSAPPAAAAAAPPEPSTTIAPAATQPRRGFEESDNDDPVEDLIHRERIRERDLLRTPGCLALGRKAFRLEDMPRVTERDREILRRVLYILREAERRNCGELEVPRPREWALSDFGDTMTTEAIRARFDLRRDDGVLFRVFSARLEYDVSPASPSYARAPLMWSVTRRRRLQRLFPNLDFRLSWSVRFNVVVQTIDAIALDSNLELTRVDMEVRRSTVGVYEDSLACQLLGQTYYVHPDKTIKITVDLVVTSEVIGAFSIKELGFHFIDPLAPIAEKEIVPRVRVFIPYLGIEGWISITLDDGHLIVELKYLQAMHAEGEYQLALSNYRQMELWCFFKLDMALLARPTLAGVIRKFANAIARKAAEARGETFVPTPYDETAVDAVVVTAVPPVAPVVAPEPAPPAVSAPAGPPLKALEAMGKKELGAELDGAGVPSKGRAVKNTAIEILRDLVRRLRAGEPAASLKATLVADGAKKVKFDYCKKGNANGTDYLIERFRGLAETDPLRLEFDELARRDVAAAAADELPVDRLQRVPDPGLVNLPTIWPRMRFPVRVATLGLERPRLFPASRYAQPECGVRYPYGSKLGLFKGRVGGGARCFERLASVSSETRVRERLDAFDSTPRPRESMCYRVIRDAKRRIANHLPRAEDDQCPAYYGVDYRESRGARTCQFTVHEGTKTLAQKSAPADRQRSREALRSLENAFSEFMPERFYGIRGHETAYSCPEGKFQALASIPGARGGGNRDDAITFGLYDSKLEVSIQEKHRISEVVVARIEEVNVARAEAEKPLPPLHVAGTSRRLERYKADFALQLKDLAYVEAADEAYLRDQAAALAPPEPMPDGSRPPIDAHSRRVARAGLANTFERMIERRRDRAAREREEAQARRRTAASTAAVANFYRDPCGLLEPRALAPPGQPRRVAKLYVVPNCELVTPPPPPIYHVTENGERLLVLYATRVQRPLIPAIQQVHKQRAEFLSLFDESEVEMAAAMFDSRPEEIARPLLFESEEDAERRAEPAAPKRKRKSRKKKRKAPAEAPPPAAAPAKKKKKRSRRRAPPAEISEYERTRMRNIAAGNKKLYSLGLIHPPPEVVADPEHSWWSERARTRVFFVSRLRRALPQAQS
ncbi:hypothetical protein JL722_3537 [Aureococcus anophagefferens]|nr:hypothetical protein JL722_3537 [Aureococcus anophagefferens]